MKTIVNPNDHAFDNYQQKETDGNQPQAKPTTAVEMYEMTRGFMLHAHPHKAQKPKERQETLDRLEGICKKLTDSLDNESPKFSYVGLAFLPKPGSKAKKTGGADTLAWISHIKRFLGLVVEALDPKAR